MSGVRKVVDCDVLIVGGGLAACMAALEATKRDVRVVLVDKGRLGRSGSRDNSNRDGTSSPDPIETPRL